MQLAGDHAPPRALSGASTPPSSWESSAKAAAAMESYPPELTGPPVPLVALIGSPEVQKAVGDYLRSHHSPRMHAIGIADPHSAAGTFGERGGDHQARGRHSPPLVARAPGSYAPRTPRPSPPPSPQVPKRWRPPPQAPPPASSRLGGWPSTARRDQRVRAPPPALHPASRFCCWCCCWWWLCRCCCCCWCCLPRLLHLPSPASPPPPPRPASGRCVARERVCGGRPLCMGMAGGAAGRGQGRSAVRRWRDERGRGGGACSWSAAGRCPTLPKSHTLP